MQDTVADRGTRRGTASGWLTLLTVALAAAGLGLIWVSQHTHRWGPPPAPQAGAAADPAVGPDPAAGPDAAGPDAAGLHAEAGSGAAGSGAAGSGAGSDSWPRYAPHSYRVPAPAAAPPVSSTAWLGRSVPVTVRIPSIGVSARIIPLGLDGTGAAAVPPLTRPMLASWYDLEAAPGQAGPAVLAGHVDSAVTGPAVFYRLGDLRRGDLVYVTRADHRTAVFRVSHVALYREQSFPRFQVYGYSARPVLRIITCGGQFDDKHHVYLDRTVAFATYLGQR